MHLSALFISPDTGLFPASSRMPEWNFTAKVANVSGNQANPAVTFGIYSIQ